MPVMASASTRPLRRAAIFLVLCLLLGAASTVALAWASAMLVPVAPINPAVRGAATGKLFSGTVALDGDHLAPWLIRLRRPTAQRTIWFEKGRIYSKQGVGPPGGSSAAVQCWSFATSTRGHPDFTRGPVEISEAVQRELARTPMVAWGGMEDQRGWPFPALRGRAFGTTNPRAGSIWYADGGSILPARSVGATGVMADNLVTMRLLPMEPMWSGFALDAGFWTLAWIAILLLGGRLAGVVHRRLRVPAGHCPRCRYDLKGDLAAGCPECGWGRAEGNSK